MNSNPDYSAGANNEALVICLYASTGNVNWLSRIFSTGFVFNPIDGVVSPDSTKFYLTGDIVISG